VAVRDEAGFEEFVAARSDDLLRTAVLLTRDRGHAEDLLQTALVKARYAEDLSEAATAQTLGCSVATVKSQTTRGLARLRAHLVVARDTEAPSAVLEER
jgi:DNA-directed RNA polymerase specialized sigma24 family protein